ncbi:DUF421 domain-containing protein [Rhabdobacter roseus]|uniref:Uncharacterized membrane protein YcaP (DUF421 family) n=1 Tax=Rhabdobacter roseus TaxID=1655419 RepID=A0A840U2N7_9BACT|nr:YetF domain-containing protein [Rhabdobacter roseus]MBB5286618.1 uncharacterized membrane protein YcaP (DUF421 family) [Rhabdobacter roseus]
MSAYEIRIDDWARILFGNVPASFFIEVVVRTAFVYLILMVSMRMMGKRMASQLGRNELAAMTSLAAAIGVPLQSADRGLLPAVIIAVIVVFVQQYIAKIATTNETFEKITQDNIDTLVKDSTMNLKNMEKTRLSRARVFSQLRSSGIRHLGEVKRLYIEANGSFTLIKNEEEVPGLSVLPDLDPEFAVLSLKPSGQRVCFHCGNAHPTNEHLQEPCENCQATHWVDAVEAKKEAVEVPAD